MIFEAGKRVIIHGLEILVLVVLILAALYVSVGRILIGSADNYKDDLESFLETRLNTPVRVGRLEGSWSYLDPGLTIRDLIIGTDDDPAIALSMVSVELNSFASLIKWNPVVSELRIDGLRLTAIQDDAGAWAISGLPPQQGGRFDAEFFMDSLPYVKLVSLKDIEINLLAQQTRYRLRSESEDPFELASEEGVRTLSLPLTVERIDRRTGDVTANMMKLIGRYRGDVRKTGGFSTELYFQLPSLELTDFLPPLTFDTYLVSRIGVRGEFWFGYLDGRYAFTGVPVVSEVLLESGDRSLTLVEDLKSEFRLSGTSVDDSYLDIKQLSGTLALREVRVEGASVAFTDNQIAARIPQLDIGLIGKVLTDLGHRMGLIDERGLKAIESMNPKGVLQNVLFVTNRDGRQDGMKLTASVMDASINAYQGSPGIDNLNGFVSLGPERGYIDVSNETTILDFARMFDDSWYFDSARGRINYNYQPEYLQITSGLIELVTGGLRARGKLNLNLPRETAMQTWSLVVGIENGPLLDAPRYLPNVLSQGVRQWLTDSMLGGTVVESGLVFHGSLHGDAPKIEKVHELYFKVEDATLDYAPGWPAVEDLAATIYVDNDGVRSQGASGRVYESVLGNGLVNVPLNIEGKADAVKIDADLAGPLSDGIRLFSESPLAEVTGNMAKDWTGTGQMKGKLALEIPVGDRAGGDILSDVSVSLDGNDLYMPRYDLEIVNIHGVINYENNDGVVAEKIRAGLFGQPVSGSIDSAIHDDGGEVIINIAGAVDIADLHAWSGQILLTRAGGLMEYEAEVHVPFGEQSHKESYIEARSNLVGVKLDLPDPMTKSESGEVPMVYRQYFLDPGHRVEFEFDQKVKGALKIVDEVVQGGHLQFGPGPLEPIDFEELTVGGTLEFVDYSQWQALAAYFEDASEVSLERELAGRLASIDVDIGLLDAFGMELRDVRSMITRKQDHWHVALSNEILAGVVSVPDHGEPMRVDLDFLRFEAGEREDEDPLADVFAGELIAVDFSTGELRVGEENYGSWQFEFRPVANGAVLRNLGAEVKGVRIIAPAEVYWETGKEMKSRFKGVLVADDLASALEQWGFASSIRGNDFRFVADFQWPGSPAMISLESLVGKVNLTKGSGRFVQAESAGALKLLGIFDFASLSRRFRFDFSDIVEEGFSFRKIKGGTRLNKGVVNIAESIVIEGASSTIKVGGTLNLNSNELDNEMIVTLPVNRNLPWYAAYTAIATGPLMGAGVILAQKIFESQIDQISSAKYKITGTLDNPRIEFVSIFTDEMREVILEEADIKEVNPEEPETLMPQVNVEG